MPINLSKLAASFVLLFSIAAFAYADVKIKQRQSVGGQTIESAVYIKGKRERREQKLPGLNSQIAIITQCDLKRTVQLNDQTRKYIIMPFDENSSTQPIMANPAPASQPTRKGGIITYQMNVVDTGERKQMFGLTARHIKTSIITDSTPDACNPEKQHIETDGWYVDLDASFDCANNRPPVPMMRGAQAGCRDEIRFKQTGSAAKLGYPLMLTTTIYDRNNQPTTSFTQETVELSRETLSPSLFDVPTDYAETKDVSELYGLGNMNAMAAMAGRNEANNEANNDASNPSSNANNQANNSQANETNNAVSNAETVGAVTGGKVGAATSGLGAVSGIFGRKPKKKDSNMNSTTNNTANNSTANNSSSAKPASSATSGTVAPKKAGSIRVGVIAVGNPSDAKFSTDAARERLISSLSNAGLDAVPINAQSISKVFDEARAKECDFVLYTDVSALKQPGKTADEGGALFGKSPLGRLGGKSSAVYDATVNFRLLPVPESGDEAAPQLESNANGKADSDAGALNKAFESEAKAVAGTAKKRG